MKIPTARHPMIVWALCYASMGWDVFPLKPGTKDGFYRYDAFPGRPSQKYPNGNPYSWQAQASHDIDRVRKFWTDHPDANIGCATGIRSGGLYVCDFDREHVLTDSKTGKPYLVGDGLERLKQWEKETGQKLNDETAISITGNGGYHYFYRADGKRLYNNGGGASDIFGEGTGNDIRGNGSFSILPPSTHPNGNRYEWEQSPDEYPPIEADAVFYRYWNISEKRSESGKKAPSYEELQGVTSGRHDALKSYMAKIIGQTNGKLDREAYVSILRGANEALEVPIGSGKGDRKDEFEKTVLPLVDNLLRREEQKVEEQKEPDYWKKAREAWSIDHPGQSFNSDWKEAEASLERHRDDLPRYERLATNVADSTKAKTAPQTMAGVSMKKLEDAEEKDVEWLIPEFIPKGCITLIAGDGGSGKSTCWSAIAAAISNGQDPDFLKILRLPDDVGMNPFDNSVFFFTAEDDVERVLLKRLRIEGANVSNIRYLSAAEDEFSAIKFNSLELQSVIAEYRPTLCIFDPVQSFIPPDMHMGERNAMRQVLTPLMGYGEKYGTSFLLVAHTNKRQGAWGRNRIADSADLWDACRSVIIVGQVPGEQTRYFSQEKNNYAPLAQTRLFTVDSITRRATFHSFTDKHDCDFAQAASLTKSAPDRTEAKDFIISYLKDNSERDVKVRELDESAKAYGISNATLKRAKSELKESGKIRIRPSGRTGRGQGTDWVVSLI